MGNEFLEKHSQELDFLGRTTYLRGRGETEFKMKFSFCLRPGRVLRAIVQVSKSGR